MFCVCHVFLSIYCSLVVTCWERADLLALMCCFIVTFPCGILGQVWCLIVSIADLCLPFMYVCYSFQGAGMILHLEGSVAEDIRYKFKK